MINIYWGYIQNSNHRYIMGNAFIDRLRLKWATMTKGLGYSTNLTEQIYDRYLNHHKIIHFRDGFPVYSLSSPALFSKPMANFLSRVQHIPYLSSDGHN